MPEQDASPRAPGGTSCLCPLCMLMGGAGALRPEVAEHLRAAARELGLALRAALDGVAEDPWQPPGEQGGDPGGP